MLTISGVSKSYGGRTLFRDATLQVNRGDRIGLVGPNGAGKSTLFNLILGEESADEGNITFQRGISFGFLPQESAPAGGNAGTDCMQDERSRHDQAAHESATWLVVAPQQEEQREEQE